MRLVRILCLFLLLLHTFKLGAQLPSTPEGIKQPRILILMDGSSSMLNPWSNDLQRFGAAAKVVSALMDSIYRVNNQVEFALRVYGHQYPAQENNCTDTKREVMFSKDNYTQMALRMASLHPSGVSPIAYALKEAATNDLQDELHNAYSIILITDGGESCNGDICDVVRTLIDRKIFFKPYIISMVDYAPLRNQYACLGNFLTVGKETDIAPAVSSIVTDYRPMLKLPIITAPKPTEPKKPEVTTIVIPKWIPEHSDVSTISITVKDRMPDMIHYNPALHGTIRSEVPVTKISPAPSEPVTAVTGITATPATAPRKDTAPILAVTPKPVDALPLKPIEKPAKDTAKTAVVIRALPPSPSKPITPPKPDDAKPKEITFSSSSEDGPESGTRIYFTDGHGKFYKTSPKLQLVDAKGTVVKQFFRTIDAAGNPDLLQLPAGTFTLVVPGRRNSVLRNVIILPGKVNKFVAVVNNGSLAFNYPESPGKAVEEFEATVNILFEPGPTVRQKCSLELEYTPGNYHVEVNTLPVSKYNVDIDFGNTSVLPVKVPGFVQFTNTTAMGKVALYNPVGDRFLRFFIMDLNGNPANQKLRLQPGAYEVRWTRLPGSALTGEAVQRFNVKSNAVTEIELR